MKNILKQLEHAVHDLYRNYLNARELQSKTDEVQSTFIKNRYNILKRQLSSLENNYESLLKKNRNRYPLKWMQNNKGIKSTFERYPHLIPMLNILFNLNRWSFNRNDGTASDEKMKPKEQIHHEDGNPKGPYAMFVANDEFYEKIADKIIADDYFRSHSVRKKISKVMVRKTLYELEGGGTPCTCASESMLTVSTPSSKWKI